jgi:hypothetical protein
MVILVAVVLFVAYAALIAAVVVRQRRRSRRPVVDITDEIDLTEPSAVDPPQPARASSRNQPDPPSTPHG